MSPDERAAWPAFRSCGVRIDAVTLDDAARMIAAGDAKGAVHLCNAYTLSLASKDDNLAAVLERGSLNLPDGMPLIWISRRLGLVHMTGRVYGPQLMARVLDLGQSMGTRHYFYGSSPDTLSALLYKVKKSWPAARVAGAESPPFTNDVSVFEATVDKVIATGADVVFLGLGTPKQDFVAAALAARCSATMVAVGAAFDFISGAKKQAPPAIQRMGLEWAYRLASEPRRLGRRYLIGNTLFMWANMRRRPKLVGDRLIELPSEPRPTPDR